MRIRNFSLAAALALSTLFALPGCAVERGQSTVGEYLDDTAITTRVKTQLIESKQVDASAVSVETLNGAVMLSGFAKTAQEKSQAGQIAETIKGVKSVKNEILVRP